MTSSHAGGGRQSSPVVCEWQSPLLLLVDARGKKGVRMGVPAVMLRRGKNMLWWWVVTVAAGG